MVITERQLSAWDAAILRKIAIGLTSTGGLKNKAQKYIRIGREGEKFGQHPSGEITVPIDYQFFSDVLLAPCLVVEDVHYDISVYKQIFTREENRPGSYPVSFDPIHGGGGRIAFASQAAISNHRIVCVILDTDRVAPQHFTQKLDLFKADLTDPAWPLLFAYELSCAELENVVPLEIYADEFRLTHANTIATLLKIDDEETRTQVPYDERFWLYFDVKRGLREAGVISVASDDARKWVLSKISSSSVIGEAFELPGFGAGAMRRLLARNDFQAMLRDKISSGRWQYVFSGIINAVYWILISPKVQYIS